MKNICKRIAKIITTDKMTVLNVPVALYINKEDAEVITVAIK